MSINYNTYYTHRYYDVHSNPIKDSANKIPYTINGLVLRCILPNLYLTLGNLYTVNQILDGYQKYPIEGHYKILNDNYDETWYDKKHFASLDLYREEQINKILFDIL